MLEQAHKTKQKKQEEKSKKPRYDQDTWRISLKSVLIIHHARSVNPLTVAEPYF